MLQGRVLGGRYRVGDPIGAGGMGTVYHAVDQRLDRPVALKVVTLGGREVRARARASFRREAEAAARLSNHPNVVPVYDYGTDPELDVDYLVMELLQGEDLSTRLQKTRRLPAGIALRILLQAARGVSMGHRRGMIHRDLKPANLFLMDDGGPGEVRVRVLDFGIVKLMGDDATQTVFAPLSALYASPEQFHAGAELTPASDVFSLGAVGFRMLTGEDPRSKEDFHRLALRMAVEVPRVRGVAPAVEELLRRAMAHDPAARYTDADAFAEAVEAALRRLEGTTTERAGQSDDGSAQDPSASANEPSGGADPTRRQTAADTTTVLSPGAGMDGAGSRGGAFADRTAAGDGAVGGSPRTSPRVATPPREEKKAPGPRSRATRGARWPVPLAMAVLIVGGGGTWYAAARASGERDSAPPSMSPGASASPEARAGSPVPASPAPLPPPPASDSMRDAYLKQLARDTAGAGAVESQPARRFPVGENPVAAVRSGWPLMGEVPRSGSLLPYRRIVAYYGNPASTRLGVLGEYDPAEMMRRWDRVVAAWNQADPETPVVPALHLVAAVAKGEPGPAKKYREVVSDTLIEKVYGWARQRNGILFLDIQPGHSSVQEMLPHFERFLTRPDVHLSLDPEFAMRGGAIPGTRIGTIVASDVNWVIGELDRIVRANRLPPKVLVVHRFTRNMLPDAEKVRPTSNVQVVINMDGWGAPWLKRDAYRDYVMGHPVQYAGFKIFYHNDARSGDAPLSPADLLRLRPVPRFVVYQ